MEQAGETVWRILSLSPADPMIAYRKMLCVAIEPHGASLVLGTRFLSRLRIKDQRPIPLRKTAIRRPRHWLLRWPCTSPSKTP